jgi:hypothetical protein
MHERLNKSDEHQRRIVSLKYANITFPVRLWQTNTGNLNGIQNQCLYTLAKLQYLRCNRARRSGHGDHQL